MRLSLMANSAVIQEFVAPVSHIPNVSDFSFVNGLNMDTSVLIQFTTVLYLYVIALTDIRQKQLLNEMFVCKQNRLLCIVG